MLPATPGWSRSRPNFTDSSSDSDSSQNCRLRPTPTQVSTQTPQPWLGASTGSVLPALPVFEEEPIFEQKGAIPSTGATILTEEHRFGSDSRRFRSEDRYPFLARAAVSDLRTPLTDRTALLLGRGARLQRGEAFSTEEPCHSPAHTHRFLPEEPRSDLRSAISGTTNPVTDRKRTVSDRRSTVS